MKLQSELMPLKERLSTILPKIREYAPALETSGEYKDFETRLAWDCLRAVTPSSVVCEWYKKYDCNDSHIDTLAKKALRMVYPIVKSMNI